MSAQTIQVARILTPTRELAPGWIRVLGAHIVALGAGGAGHPATRELPELTLVPGFIDGHCHGGGGASFDDPDPVGLRRAVAVHRLQGTTSLVASLVSATPAHLAARLAQLADVVADGELVGVHLEGPWLSTRRAGAHDESVLRAPCDRDVDLLLDAGTSALRMVTMAPELPSADTTINRLSRAGIRVAIGHTDAAYAAVRHGLQQGATVATHLGNGMRPWHTRDPGPVQALLEDDRVTVELIADGHHLHPQVLRWFAQLSAGRFVLVSDAMSATGVGDGRFRLGTRWVTVQDGVARLATEPNERTSSRTPGALAGSTLTLAAAVRFAVQQAGIPLAAALAAATSTPARLLGLTDRGRLHPGARADLVLLDRDLQVCAVMRGGHWLTEPPEQTRRQP